MSAKTKTKTVAGDKKQLDASSAKKLVQGAMGLAGAGVALGLAAAFADPKRFAFSYLVGFVWVTTVALGALFFVILQHLTRAGWSVAARRHMEWMSSVLPACVVLFLPVAYFAHDIYHHWMGPQAATDHLIQGKSAYLNPTFFYLRAAVFLLAWAGIALWFSRTSTKQDQSGDPAITTKMQAAAAPATIVFALTITFSAFDWVMSLDPHWYSTIFGVYIFAGAATSSLSLLALVTIGLQRAGLLRKVSTVEHRHDIGKLLFGFTVFWAYIAFSQFILIWYANIPEETIFYKHRWEGSWAVVSMALLFGHFVLPFVVLIARTTKRNMGALGAVAAWMLVMHYVDLYWLVMPTLDHHGAHPTWIDLAGLLGPAGVGALIIAMRAAKGPLYPLKDPRLPEAMKLENL